MDVGTPTSGKWTNLVDPLRATSRSPGCQEDGQVGTADVSVSIEVSNRVVGVPSRKEDGEVGAVNLAVLVQVTLAGDGSILSTKGLLCRYAIPSPADLDHLDPPRELRPLRPHRGLPVPRDGGAWIS